MHTHTSISIAAHLAHKSSHPKQYLQGNTTLEPSLLPTLPPSPLKDVYISKKKRYKLAAAAAAASGTPLTPPHKTNINNAKDQHPEFKQEEALCDIGITSLELVDNEQFGLIDPTLGDWACQLRVLWLIDISNKYKVLKATQPSQVTPQSLRGENPVFSVKELELLGMYRLGTLFTSCDVDRLGMRKTIRTRARATTPEENAAGWKFGSSSQNKAAFDHIKTMLGDAVNQSLIELLQNSHLPDKEAYLADFTRTDIVRRPVRDQDVSVVGFFGGCKAILDLAAERDLPLTVTLKKFVRDMDDNVRLGGVETATFSSVEDSSGKRVYVRDKEAGRGDQLGMVIHMFSCFSAASNATSETNRDTEAFFANARRLAFDEFNASYDAIVAVHPQHPPQTYIRGADGELLTDESGKPLELLHKPPGVQIDATPVLTRMRERAARFALAHGIGQGTYYTAAIAPDKQPAGKHFDESIPLHIEHIHVASGNGAALEMQNYVSKYGTVVIPADAAVAVTTIANAGYKAQTTKIGIPECSNSL
jgi:hypothetical protein